MRNDELADEVNRTPRPLLSFFVYSNLFIALCAFLMTHQAYHFLLRTKPDFHLLGFVVFSTICSYSFHWYLTGESVIPSPRITWVNRYRYVHVWLFFIGLIGAVYFFFFISDTWPWVMVAVIATFLYSAPKIPHSYFRVLRKVALGKTIFLAFVWMYVTTILPVLVSGNEWDEAYTIFAIGRFFLIYAICILFDYRDRADDRRAGIRSLITYLSEKGITILFYGSLVIFFVSTILLWNYGYDLLSLIFLLVPGIITAAIYDYAKNHYSDMFWYFVMDGLMALSSLLTWIAAV
jgi:4-hydroxybenzoate polyprenyltransferase